MTAPDMFNGLLFLVAILGHLAIGCAAFNQLHATGIPRKPRKISEKITYGVSLLILVWMAWQFLFSPEPNTGFFFYRNLCLIVAGLISIRWAWLRWQSRQPAALLSFQKQPLSIGSQMRAASFHGLQANLLKLVPGNQSLMLSVEQRTLQLPEWPKPLDHISIAHLTDLHFNGKLDREYFEHVCQECNRWEPELVLVTGDVADNPDCVSWLPSTLAKIRASLGKFYILGNHDHRIPEQRLREALANAGYQHASGSWIEVSRNGASMFLAGNERPWFPGVEQLPPTSRKGPKILLSHTPDHFAWAHQQGFDLMFAGHTHGGQVRLPIVGPIIAPSRFGVRYASGTFQKGDLIMHVSRGVSGDDPIRWNCLPELGIFTIVGRG